MTVVATMLASKQASKQASKHNFALFSVKLKTANTRRRILSNLQRMRSAF